MGTATEIEWTDATWNPVVGCTRVSEGCRNCYAERMAARLRGNKVRGYVADPRAGHGEVLNEHGRWSGVVNVLGQVLEEPLRWKKPRQVFVNSMSDLFHEAIPDEAIAAVFGVMAAAKAHTFQVLTKRPERMREWVSRMAALPARTASSEGWKNLLELAACDLIPANPPKRYPEELPFGIEHDTPWPLPNVWLGVSVEHQAAAAERVPALVETPAAVRFLSCEPLLGAIDLDPWKVQPQTAHGRRPCYAGELHWIIVGGESGPKARPMHPDWARSLRDQATTAGIPFFFKQWGEWAPGFDPQGETGKWCSFINLDGTMGSAAVSTMDHEVWTNWCGEATDGFSYVQRLGKKANGRKLDHREWDEFPAAVTR